MPKIYPVEEAANALIDTSSPRKFDESIESVSKDSSWDEASLLQK